MSITDLASLLFAQVRIAEAEADRVYDPMIGLVTDNKDPDKLGRVKVKLPTLSTDDTTWWAPIVTLGGGAQRGWFSLPEVDDEVLVMFEHGDMTRPVIIGQLWGGKDKPPLDNKDGKNGRRALHSRGGSKITFDDADGKVVIEDGGGVGVLTIDARSNKITLEAKQGDVAIHCKDDLAIVASAVEMKATSSFTIKGANVKAGSDAAVHLKGTGVLKINGAQVGINNGGAQAPSAPTATPAEVPDDSGRAGAAASPAPAQAQAGSSVGAASGGAKHGVARAAAPASTPPGPPPVAAVAPPAPIVLMARWTQPTARFGAAVKLEARCSNAAGKPATFTIRDAHDASAAPLGTVTATCGADTVVATWTAHAGPAPDQVVFQVAVADSTADSGVLGFLVAVTGSITISGEPAADLPLVLEPERGAPLKGKTDARGKFTIEDVPAGRFRLRADDGLIKLEPAEPITGAGTEPDPP